jgi:hypothetical protein
MNEPARSEETDDATRPSMAAPGARPTDAQAVRIAKRALAPSQPPRIDEAPDLDAESDADEAPLDATSIGSFLTSLSRPAESPAFRAHDRTHLEFAIDYKVPTEDRDATYQWEAYFFAPESLRLDSRTYNKDDVYEDLQTYVRFAVPECSFHALVEAPIASLRAALAGRDEEAAMRELRLFACQVRAAGEETRRRIAVGLESGEDRARWTIAAERFVDDARLVTTGLREVASAREGVPDPLATAIEWIDEDVSRLIEALVGGLAMVLRERGATESVIAKAESVAADEARYRDRVGLEGVGRVGMSRRRIEQIEFRRHVLKRFTSSVLWLSPEVRPAAEWVTHSLNALAAALAMSFAVLAALWNGNDSSGTSFMRWALVVIVAYAMKDRIKAILQARFAQVVSRNFPDRSWRILDRERKLELGAMEEQSGFVALPNLPPEVLAIRRETQRHVFEEHARPETVLFHKKSVSLRRDPIARADRRFDALTEILRLDVRRWLVHTDDPKRRFVFADPDSGTIGTASAPRVYNIAVVYRLRREGEAAPWHRVRVVISRKGIRRLDAIR